MGKLTKAQRRKFEAELSEYSHLPELASWCEDCKGEGDLGGGYECTYCNTADIERRDYLRAALQRET